MLSSPCQDKVDTSDGYPNQLTRGGLNTHPILASVYASPAPSRELAQDSKAQRFPIPYWSDAIDLRRDCFFVPVPCNHETIMKR